VVLRKGLTYSTLYFERNQLFLHHSEFRNKAAQPKFLRLGAQGSPAKTGAPGGGANCKGGDESGVITAWVSHVACSSCGGQKPIYGLAHAV
jgi:hypothetical protein